MTQEICEKAFVTWPFDEHRSLRIGHLTSIPCFKA